MRVSQPWADVLAGGFLPGALAGVHTAGLLFFLNPGLPFSPAPVLRAVAIYGAILGLAGLAVHLPFTWGRPRRARRLLPWVLTLTLAFAALLDWTHASYYAYFLPPGINERLIKTAIWLSLGALISFYTALLHSLHRRPYGWRSRYGLALVAVLSIYAMLERREAFRPPPERTRRPAAMAAASLPRLWVIGLDTATLDAVLPLAGSGRLPFLAAVLQQGAHGRLESLSPTREKALWMTLVTGKYPYKHGVTGGRVYPADLIAPGARLQLLPVGNAFRRWGTFGSRGQEPRLQPRRALALWEILPRLGIPAGEVGWPASSPASRESAFALSDRFFAGDEGPGSVRPSELAARARPFRVSEREIDSTLAVRFGPKPPQPVLAALAGDLWRQSLATALLAQHPEVGALFLALPGLDEVSSRDFGGFDAVQFNGAQDAGSEAAAERVAAYYALLDGFLAATWKRGEGGPRLLAIVSPYGVESRGEWARLWEGITQSAAARGLEGHVEGAPDGILLLYGDGIRPGALLTGARLVDVVPTLLYGLGFPLARDLDGQVLTAAFDKRLLARRPLALVPSYEGLAVR
jgi:type I phosphodiesterase/nucleotide pyrophosphatase